jgi:hypothetical protein
LSDPKTSTEDKQKASFLAVYSTSKSSTNQLPDAMKTLMIDLISTQTDHAVHIIFYRAPITSDPRP